MRIKAIGGIGDSRDAGFDRLRVILAPRWKPRVRARAGQGPAMPTIFRFVIIVGALVAAGYSGLYVLATQFEPQPREVTQPIGTVKIRKQ